LGKSNDQRQKKYDHSSPSSTFIGTFQYRSINLWLPRAGCSYWLFYSLTREA